MKKNKKLEAVQAKFLEVHGDGSNPERLIKKFMKKVRKEEVLKPFYGKLMYHQTRGQKRRQKKLKAIFQARKKENEQSE